MPYKVEILRLDLFDVLKSNPAGENCDSSTCSTGDSTGDSSTSISNYAFNLYNITEKIFLLICIFLPVEVLR